MLPETKKVFSSIFESRDGVNLFLHRMNHRRILRMISEKKVELRTN